MSEAGLYSGGEVFEAVPRLSMAGFNDCQNRFHETAPAGPLGYIAWQGAHVVASKHRCSLAWQLCMISESPTPLRVIEVGVAAYVDGVGGFHETTREKMRVSEYDVQPWIEHDLPQ